MNNILLMGGKKNIIVPFTVSASDSFNRADGAIGNTDGFGVDGISGGGGKSWTNQIGTWGITSNKARALTVVSNNAIATVDTGLINGVVDAKINTTSATGVILRYVDVNNYVRAYIVASNTVNVVQVVGGTPSTLINKPATYTAGAELVVRLDDLNISVEYNGVYYGAAVINSVFATSTLHGIYANAAGSSLNLDEWHFVNLPAYRPINKPSVTKVLSGEYRISTPMIGDVTRCAEWDVKQEKTVLGGYSFTSNVVRIMNMRIVKISDGTRLLASYDSGWESAGLIGAAADISGDYGYFGSIHQNEQMQSFSIAASNSQILPRWKTVYCKKITIDQNINTVYPKDKTTVIGTTSMQHFFTSGGLMILRSHTYSAGYKIYTFYGAMLPVNNPVVDTYQVGENPSAVMALDDGAKNLNTQTSICKVWKAGGDYTVIMRLPSGGPDASGDWSKSGGYKAWFNDKSTSPQKFYVNYVSGNFADAIVAENSSHVVQYEIVNGIP